MTSTNEEPRPGGASSLIGTTISARYKIERLLGEGGMGAVYAAEHTLMRKRVAVKVLHPIMSRMSEVVARFEREAMAASHIDHPNVAAATDFGKLADDSFFLVLEYVEGKSLRVALEEGPLAAPRALHITEQIASALVRAHALGIVHRDLKPENVMLVDRNGDPDFVKVLDFGIAKVPVDADGDAHDPLSGEAPRPALTQLGMVYGTPEYMAPEQALGELIDARADLYALGIMTYEMLTGARPFIADSPIALLGMHVNAPVPPMIETAPNANIPPDVESIVGLLLAKDRADRVQDAKELLSLIAPIIRPPNVAAAPEVPPAPASPSARFRAWVRRVPRAPVLAGLVALAIVLVVSITVFVSHGNAGSAADEARAAASASVAASSLVDDRVREGQELVAQGNYLRAIEILTKVSSENRARPEVRRALAMAYAETERYEECMLIVAPWLNDEPTIAADTKVRVMVRDAAISTNNNASRLAFGLLEMDMGTIGPDDLYDIAFGASGQYNAEARERARKDLHKPELRSVMSPSLAVTLDVAAAGHACKVKSLFERAQTDGDLRTVTVLKPLAARAPSGWFGLDDGLACIHDGSLNRTITAIESRMK